ncbi:MAG: FlgD immunoglobulin-like domain containing protein [Fibrobacterota bacterium]
MLKRKLAIFFLSLILAVMGRGALSAATIGPVKISVAKFPIAEWVGSQGYLGMGHFVAYSTVCRYGVVAVAHDTIMTAISGRNAIATFDGGLTWKSLIGGKLYTQIHGEILPPGITDWPFSRIKDNYTMNTQNAVYQASHINNDLFVGGFFQCNDGGAAPVWERRVRYDGQYWVNDPYSLADSTANKCMPCEAIELPSGQLWFVWKNDYGSSGLHVKYSNDSGATWGKVNGVRVLESYNNHVGCTPYLAVPYLNGVAIMHSKPVSSVATAGWNYSLNNVNNTPQPWSTFETILTGYNTNSVIVRGSNYDTLYAALAPAGSAGPVKVAVLANSIWSVEDVGNSAIGASTSGTSGGDAYFGPFPTHLDGRAMVTSCGEDIYCIWADKDTNGYKICAKKRLGANRWSDSIPLVSQSERIYQLAVPLKSPAGYLAFFWDFYSTGSSGLRFLNFDLSTVAVEQQPKMPNARISISAMPNPFDSRLALNYSLPTEGRVHLSIFDISGKIQKTLVDRWQSAGHKQIIWDGTDDNGHAMSNGVYFYRFECGEKRNVKKILLTR